MRKDISERVSVWSLFAMIAGLVLSIIALAGLIVPVMDSQVSDIEGQDLVFERDVPGGRVFKAETGSDIPGMMSISIDTKETESPRLSIEVYEGRKRILKEKDLDLPFVINLLVNGTGRILVELTIFDPGTYPEDLDVRISLASAVGTVSFLCGMVMTPFCCMAWLASICMALIGIFVRTTRKKPEGVRC